MLKSSTPVPSNQSSCWPLNVNTFTYQSTTIWCDLTFPLLALLSLTAPLQNTTNVMICAPGGCHLPLQSVRWEGCFASSGPFIPMFTFFSKSYWIVALFVRSVKGATKSPRPRIHLPSQHVQPGMVPGGLCIPVLRIWLLLLSQHTSLAGSKVVSRTHWQTHSLKWLAGQAAAHTHTEQHAQHNPSVMLPKLREGHTALSSSSPPGNQNAGSLVKKVCPHSPHPEHRHAESP